MTGVEDTRREDGKFLLVLICLVFLPPMVPLVLSYVNETRSLVEQQSRWQRRVLNLEREVREHDRVLRRVEGELHRVPIPTPDP